MANTAALFAARVALKRLKNQPQQELTPEQEESAKKTLAFILTILFIYYTFVGVRAALRPRRYGGRRNILKGGREEVIEPSPLVSAQPFSETKTSIEQGKTEGKTDDEIITILDSMVNFDDLVKNIDNNDIDGLVNKINNKFFKDKYEELLNLSTDEYDKILSEYEKEEQSGGKKSKKSKKAKKAKSKKSKK
jgi:hypothetical protein